MPDAVQALWEQLVELERELTALEGFVPPGVDGSIAGPVAIAGAAQGMAVTQAEKVAAIYTRLQATVSALTSSGIGECQMATPYAPLRPVGKSDGTLQWCCEHDPQHCF